MSRYNSQPRFEWLQLPELVRKADHEVNLFDFKQREEFLGLAQMGQIEVSVGIYFDLAHKAFLEDVVGSENQDLSVNMKNYMNRLGYLLFDHVVPVILEVRKKPTAALNLIEAYQQKCWFYSEAPNLRKALEETKLRCYQALERKMISDLQTPHKGEERIAKFERLFGVILQDFENYGFMNFLREFAKRVARKPEDVNLLMDSAEYECSAYILKKVLDILYLQGKYEVVTKLKEKPECDAILCLAAA